MRHKKFLPPWFVQEFNIYLPGAIFVVLQGNKNDTTEKTFKIIVQVG